MAVLAQFLVLCAFVLGFHHVQAAADTLSAADSSFCRGGLTVIYPGLKVNKCLIVEKGLREKLKTEWKDAPQILFPAADKMLKEMKNREDKAMGILIGSCTDDTVWYWLAERGSIAQAALRKQRLDISLILIPSRVHSKKHMYVLVMVDPDAPSRTSPTRDNWRHWLMVDVQVKALSDGQLHGKTLTDYHPPSPPRGSGLHRYQFKLYKQPPNTSVFLTEKEKPRGRWDLKAFVKRFRLGDPVATVQFLTETSKTDRCSDA